MPCDYSKYPANWKTEIRPAILKRDCDKCKFCGVANYSPAMRGNKTIRIVLTIAHLDHDTNNNHYDNLAARARVSPPGWKKRLMDACCQVRDAETDDSRNIAWHKFHKAMAGTMELPSPDLQSVIVVPKRKRSIRIKKPAVTLYYTAEEALAVAAGLIARVQELEGKEWE